jgi:hypothetical protein
VFKQRKKRKKMMENIAYCGLNCIECPAYIAKQTNDQELREKTAKAWSGPGFTVEPIQVNCEGCHSTGEVFFHCHECNVRKCAIEKGVNTCAECGDYPCADKLEALWKQLNNPKAKEKLDSMQN